MIKVSVALCTYNGEKYLDQQLQSIIKQTRPVDEIIICDDCSKDNTVQIIKDYQKHHAGLIKLKINPKNIQSVKNFQQGLQLSTGDIIFLSDQDDLWSANKVEHYLNHFELNPNIEVICSNGHLIDENNQSLDRRTIWDLPYLAHLQNQQIDLFHLICYTSNIATGASMALRKSFLNEILPIPSLQKMHHDEWIALIASYHNSFSLLNDKLFSYRIHAEQQVGNVSIDDTKENIEKLLKRIDPENTDISTLKRRLKKAAIAYKNLLLVTPTAINIAMRAQIKRDYKNFEQLLKSRYSLLGSLLITFEKHRID